MRKNMEENANYSIMAIKDFEFLVGYKNEGSIIELRVQAISSKGTIYDEITGCRMFYDTGYMQQVVDINWKITDDVMKTLGLHGRYNTNFQTMELNDRELVIHAGKITITLKETV